MRLIIQKAEQQQANAILALDMFCYRIKKYIGAYSAVLGDISALVFTGGIGEHAPLVREKVSHGLEHLGFSLDTQANIASSKTIRVISTIHSRARVLVIPAEEELEIARQIVQSANTYPR
jgi:acetate kinase